MKNNQNHKHKRTHRKPMWWEMALSATVTRSW
jgi:hypothetical protein